AAVAPGRTAFPRPLLRADAVDGPAGRDPRVVRRARAIVGLIADDPRIASDVECARRVLEEVGIVLLLPDEDQVRRGHEVGDERTAVRRARKRISAYAPPAGAIVRVVVECKVLLLDEGLVVDRHSPLHEDRVARLLHEALTE